MLRARLSYLPVARPSAAMIANLESHPDPSLRVPGRLISSQGNPHGGRRVASYKSVGPASSSIL